ncbi:MAG TPA: EAL domain-containing protein [Pantanalinema sp.]
MHQPDDASLRETLSRLPWEALLEATPDAVLIVDRQGLIIWCNRHAEQMFRYQEGELVGRPVEVLVPAASRKNHRGHRTKYQAAPYRRGMGDSQDQTAICKDLHELTVEISMSPLKMDDTQLIVATVRDVSQRRLTERTLFSMAYTDRLTGLGNKPFLLDRLDEAIRVAQHFKRPAAVVLTDLDLFKRINDSLGYAAGDSILQEVARRLALRFPEPITLARLGSDSFGLVLDDPGDATAAATTAQSLLALFEEPFRLGEQEVFLTPSIGISLFPEDASDAETLLQHAETAMYRAKDERNSYAFYARDTSRSIATRLTLESNLRKAIENNELVIHYQPQIRLSDARIVGAEALIRWNHPQLGMISPAQFIPLAEETGLIVPITEWVLETACRQALAWQKDGLPTIRMGINLSARHLKHDQLVSNVAEVLARTGLSPELLDLELTESLLMENLSKAASMLEELHARGVHLSIDDFGTGYSSLNYLKRLPIHALKIDRSFIHDLTTDRSSAAIVRAIVDLAHHLGMHVVAEGVEDVTQRDLLLELRCDEVQGFFYSRPVPADAFQDLLRTAPFLVNPAIAG